MIFWSKHYLTIKFIPKAVNELQFKYQLKLGSIDSPYEWTEYSANISPNYSLMTAFFWRKSEEILVLMRNNDSKELTVFALDGSYGENQFKPIVSQRE